MFAQQVRLLETAEAFLNVAHDWGRMIEPFAETLLRPL